MVLANLIKGDFSSKWIARTVPEPHLNGTQARYPGIWSLLPTRRLPGTRARELCDGAESCLSRVQPETKIAIGKMGKDVRRLMVRRVPTRADLRPTLQLAQADRGC